MPKSTNALTPVQVSRYAVQAFQPHLKLRDAKRVAAPMILTVLFAAASRISSLSDTCRRLRGIPDEHIVAEALYSTLQVLGQPGGPMLGPAMDGGHRIRR